MLSLNRPRKTYCLPRSACWASGAAVLALGLSLILWAQSRSNALTNPTEAQAVEPVTAASARLERIEPQAYLAQFSDQPHLLLDVRTPQEFASGHIPGVVNISLQTLEARLSELPTDRPIVIYCRSGNRSATAGNLLLRLGFTQLYNLGGIIAWQAQGLPCRFNNRRSSSPCVFSNQSPKR